MSDCELACPNDCAWIFDRVRVYHVMRGDTRVEWTLHPAFQDLGPYQFQLQTGRTSSNEADDWEDVGMPVTNGFYAIDSEQRVHGKFNWTHYRIQLTTGQGTYYSRPEPIYGVLTVYDWRRAQAIIRQEKLSLERTIAGTKGWLLKRRLFGEACECLDRQTGEIRDPDHLVCYGTGYVGGYFDPIPCVYVAQSLKTRYNRTDTTRGTVQDDPVMGVRMLAVPQLFRNDVWVNAQTDERWYVHRITNKNEIRGVPLVLEVELKLAPFTEVIYDFPIPPVVP